MSNQKGVKPLSQRKPPGSGKFLFTPRNPLDVPEQIKAAIEKEGKEYRWLDAKQMSTNGNFHRNYWEVYKRDTSKDHELGAFGLPADGTIRSGTCILGVRPKQVGDGHRELLEDKRKRQNQALRNQNTEFRKQLQKEGIVSKDDTDIGEETHVYEPGDNE
jgi:hypothetical protein